MKRAYQKPCAKRVYFNFEKVVAASGECGSGIVLTHAPEEECYSMTPDKKSPFVQAASLNPDICGYQRTPSK